ncbi:MAG: Lrp/AsnC family transcriptional regulator [Planctomycetota bacterium]|jgi:DNA-binding Lrp family transcriptional regulator
MDSAPELDDLDRTLLRAVQEGFPLSPEPYAELARTCGTTSEEALRRIARMRESGVIRRLGAFVNSRAIGMVTTLAAADIDDSDVERVAAVFDSWREVTHSYLREGRPNIWFALVAPSREAVDARIAEARALEGVRSCDDYPATRVFKLRVKLGVRDAAGGGEAKP